MGMLGLWRGLYPVIGDPGGTIALNYGVDNPPSKYVIDPRGRVVAKIIGPVTAVGLDSLIKRSIGEGL
jgi:alkyl hydroperoxide reductase subunit AhpC